jgi:hypothetical protein
MDQEKSIHSDRKNDMLYTKMGRCRGTCRKSGGMGIRGQHRDS